MDPFRRRRVLAASFAAILLAGSAAAEEKARAPQPITAELAGRYAVYAMMASNAYHKKDRTVFPLEKLGWTLVDRDGNPTTAPTREHKLSGLAYDIYEKQGTDEVVWAIRGTDSKRDYLWANFAVPPFALQYQKIHKEFAEYAKEHPAKHVVVTGHSAGGGLALSVSVQHGVDAVVFDASPRIFDGIGDRHRPARRVLIYQQGEILEFVRRYWKKISEVVPGETVYRCAFDFPNVSKHRSDYLARGLLDLGVVANPELAPVRDALSSESSPE